jgi:alpha-L-rhamnosidase
MAVSKASDSMAKTTFLQEAYRQVRISSLILGMTIMNTANGTSIAADGTPSAGQFPLRLSDIRVRDPFILADGETRTYYLYAQGGNRRNQDDADHGVDVYRSRDLVNWSEPKVVFERPKDGFWGKPAIWAPEVHKLDGAYYMFATFKGRAGGMGSQILRAGSPEGPFLVLGEQASTPPEQGCLDATPWVGADGAHWMVYCHEWCQIKDGGILAVKMKNDWSARIGEPVTLFHASQAPWVRAYSPGNFVTDGPFLYRMKNGTLVMIWSSFVKGHGYGMGQAISESGTVAGPWRHVEQPLFGGQGEDGGHAMILRDFSGDLLLVLHQPNGDLRERVQIYRIKEKNDRLVLDGAWSSKANELPVPNAPNAVAAGPIPPFVHPDTVPASSWSAKWIGAMPAAAAPAKPHNLWSGYRKEFSLSGKPNSAVARIAVDSKYWLWVNGVPVVREGGLKRGPTPKDTFFDEIELAPHLRKGTNAVAILVWYFGKEGFSHKSSGHSGLLFELAAGKDKIVSDSSWRALLHPAFGDTDVPHPNYRLPESNIRFDAGKDIVGWERPGFDATSWAPAAELGAPDGAPWGRLVKRPLPFWKDYGRKPYANAAALPRIADGKPIQAKLPYNAQITPYLKISAKAGEVIKIQMDNYRGGSEPNVRAEYVTRDGEQEFECFGWMNGHEVHYEIPAGIQILDLQYRETGFATEFAGTFECDDEFLNRLRVKALRTLYITMRDTYMDCPDRERALWWGDAVNELGESFYAFDRRADFLTRKCMLDLIAWQKPDGVLFSPIPAGNWDRDLPLQMLASIGRTGFWTYSFFSGDMATLDAVYPGMKRYLQIWEMKPDGLVMPRPGSWAWGDWGNNIDMAILYNAWYHIGLQGLRNAALALKKESDLPWIDARMKSIEAAFNKTYWTGTEYRAPDYKGQTDDRANAMAVIAGLAGPEHYPALIELFRKQSHASPYMEKYVLEALCLMDQPELAQERIKQRYAKMVNHPAYTTLWEGWGIGAEGFGGGTINHAWSGGPLTIMSQYFAGIAPTAAGFSAYHVLPQMGALQKITAKVVTVKGDIALQLSSTRERFALELSSPAGTRATVGIPVPKGRAVQEVTVNGRILWRAGQVSGTVPGVRFVTADSRYLLFEVDPGVWSFSARNSG